MIRFVEIVAIIWCAYTIFSFGYYFGEKNGKKTMTNWSDFYKNQVKKQAAQISSIQDRRVYLSIGEIEDFLAYMKDESEEGFGADEDYPVLCIVNPLREEPDFRTNE